MSLWKIPMLFYCRPKIIHLDDDSIKVKIRLKRRVKNHLGSMYLGALTIGADITSGYFAFHHLQKNNQKISLIFKDIHADFYRRAMSDVVFECSQGLEIQNMIKESMQTKQRVNFPVNVFASVPSISKDNIAKFILTLSVKVK